MVWSLVYDIHVCVYLLAVMGLLFGPAIKYHNINGRIFDKLEPAMLKMETSLHIKRKKRKGTSDYLEYLELHRLNNRLPVTISL